MNTIVLSKNMAFHYFTNLRSGSMTWVLQIALDVIENDHYTPVVLLTNQ